ncbi:MAG: hypothetical protein OQJ89_05665 [Kangiellaceae bacterium]|nr:hypothetical protein [Kangiellaceae bacterium]MCW8999411.1 hypothetical protein [Kangiellaceae bacterium]MCW9016430.1 hypothetical protein [Kangiellaceae bacterium]
MISDKDIAKQIAQITYDSRVSLSQSVKLVKDNCSEEESKKYEAAMARIVGYLILDVMEPLYSEHPELKPDDIK